MTNSYEGYSNIIMIILKHIFEHPLNMNCKINKRTETPFEELINILYFYPNVLPMTKYELYLNNKITFDDKSNRSRSRK